MERDGYSVIYSFDKYLLSIFSILISTLSNKGTAHSQTHIHYGENHTCTKKSKESFFHVEFVIY